MGRALGPGGRLVPLEADPRCVDVARANITRAGMSGVVEVRLGAALDVLPGLAAEGAGSFDFDFIDADKANNPEYFRWALRCRSRPGSLIVVDNVVRDGAILDAASTDPGVRGTRRLFEVMAAEPQVNATAIQTVGAQGYDGLAVALVTDRG